MLEDKLNRLAQLFHEQSVLDLERRNLACEGNLNNAFTRVVVGKKYAKVDIGNPVNDYWSGRYMVELDTQRIYGIKAYGVIHRGHYYGTLDEVDQYFWGGYTAYRKPVAA